ncbi:hypothetical protein [Legionella fallonii]|uniref:Lipase n=1 Tax=Legionella fallonii LLAP-10 TaxID=1212491 RepID=A0A098G736_9GAMM|nr:hypothetical protein [Legionella fallonii]CEG57315.1 conserved exported protein of unknown function [Legionella fallonii LLAP-10]
MDLRRVLVTLLLFLFSTLIQALPDTYPNPGIAFIHGTRDHREDAYGDYWKIDFIQSVSQGLKKPENHHVVHCDFSRYMWHKDSADCVADQLLEFITEKNISALTIYTHSDGANVIRWILSNPTYDKRYLTLKHKINQIIAIAPSSGGTPLADEVLNGGIFESSLGWLLGYVSDAVRQQRVGDMLIYNQELLLGSKGRPSLSLPFNVIVGTDVHASPFSSASYCNGYFLNSGLKLTKLYLDQCADGFLNCASQAAVGTVWFYDIDKTENNAPLSHNQSRHTCLGLAQILANELATKGVAQ